MTLFISDTWENLISDFGAEMEKLKSEGTNFQTYPQSKEEKNNYRIFSLKITQVRYKGLSCFDTMHSDYFHRLMSLLHRAAWHDLTEELLEYARKRLEKENSERDNSLSTWSSINDNLIEESTERIFSHLNEMQKANAQPAAIRAMIKSELTDIFGMFD